MTASPPEAMSWHRNARDVEAGLMAWARSFHDGGVAEDVTATTSGMQNDTFLFRLDGERVVARLAPPQGTPFPTFPKYDLEFQAKVMQLVRDRSDTPVPDVVHFEQSASWVGTPFLVMGAMEGVAAPDNPPYQADPTGWFLGGTPEQWKRFEVSTVGLLVEVHRIVDDGDVELDFLRPATDGATALARQLAYQRWYYNWAHDGESIPILERAFDLLTRTMPANDQRVLNWGDSRPANVLYRDFEAAAALDWEMASIGPPEVDLAWVTFFQKFFALMAEQWGLGKAPDLFDRDETRATYERLSGGVIEDLGWYEAYSGLRLGIIMSRIARQTAAVGQTALPDDPDDMFMFKSLLEQLLDEL